jgi:predicted nucleic acid-binding Zn ribbon protein
MILMTQISTVQVQRRDAPVTCDACGRRVARKSRQQKFCSDRCRQFAARENKARTAIKNSVLGQDTGRVTNPLKTVSKNNELRGSKSGSSIPLNVLGGHRWPNAVGVERDLLRKIIRAEVGGL